MEDLKEDNTQGGVDTLQQFSKQNAGVIRTRHSYAKVAVLLAWDAQDKVAPFRQPFATTDPFVCAAWDEQHANPNLSDSFRGIERFFSNRVIAAVEALNPDVFFTNPAGVKIVAKRNLPTVKQLLNKEIRKGLSSEDTRFARSTIQTFLATLT